MTELDALNWLKKYSAWRLDRDALRWTLKIWSTAPGTGVARMREFEVTEQTGPGVAFVGLVRLARRELEGWNG